MTQYGQTRAEHNAEQRAHFAVAAADNPRMRPADTPYVQRHVDRMLAWADLSRKDHVLDIGCGMGKFTIPMLRRGYRVDGLDLSPELLQELRAHLRPDERPDLHCIDLAHVPDELVGRHDAAIGFFVLHHLQKLDVAFRALRQYVRPGGRVAFLEPNAFNPLYYIQITVTRGMSWRADRGVVRMTQGRLMRALTDAGFVNVEARREGMLPPVLANRPWAHGLEGALDRISMLRPIAAFQLVRAVSPGPIT